MLGGVKISSERPKGRPFQIPANVDLPEAVGKYGQYKYLFLLGRSINLVSFCY
jgi:hypothetical protein